MQVKSDKVANKVLKLVYWPFSSLFYIGVFFTSSVKNPLKTPLKR